MSRCSRWASRGAAASAAVGRAAAAAAAFFVCVVGCGNGTDGTDACKQIEEARCRRAPACSIPLATPVHTSGTDVDACIRYYDIACLHGLSVAEPSGATVNACVSAIQSGACTVVQNPASDPACAWLAAPAPAPVDAATPDTSTLDASASTVPADASSGD
jgi:hypothetical protein